MAKGKVRVRSGRGDESKRRRGSRAAGLKDILVIVNPAAQAGRAGRNWARTAAALRAAGLEFETALTARPGHATEVARHAVRESCPLIVAVGGDGTLHEVMNGFFQHGEAIPTESVLGLIPYGTGGDTRRTLGIPDDITAAARVLHDGRPRIIDAGRVTIGAVDGGHPRIRHFINIGETGIGGSVSHQVNQAPKFLGGRASFLIGTLIGLATWRHKPMKVVIDDRETRELVAEAVTVANCQYYGGGMRVTPKAVPDDGLFDVIITGAIGKLEGLRGLRKIYSGTHLDDPGLRRHLEYFLARKVVVSSPEPVMTALDGDLVGTVPATYEIMPGALRVMVPA
jgi:YegS/Rv2252/BmrU family lipid kinase